MFVYEKRLQYPVNIKNPNPKLAAVIISQYGGAYSNRIRKAPELHKFGGFSCYKITISFSHLQLFFRLYALHSAFD